MALWCMYAPIIGYVTYYDSIPTEFADIVWFSAIASILLTYLYYERDLPVKEIITRVWFIQISLYVAADYFDQYIHFVAGWFGKTPELAESVLINLLFISWLILNIKELYGRSILELLHLGLTKTSNNLIKQTEPIDDIKGLSHDALIHKINNMTAYSSIVESHARVADILFVATKDCPVCQKLCEPCLTNKAHAFNNFKLRKDLE